MVKHYLLSIVYYSSLSTNSVKIQDTNLWYSERGFLLIYPAACWPSLLLFGPVQDSICAYLLIFKPNLSWNIIGSEMNYSVLHCSSTSGECGWPGQGRDWLTLSQTFIVLWKWWDGWNVNESSPSICAWSNARTAALLYEVWTVQTTGAKVRCSAGIGVGEIIYLQYICNSQDCTHLLGPLCCRVFDFRFQIWRTVWQAQPAAIIGAGRTYSQRQSLPCPGRPHSPEVDEQFTIVEIIIMTWNNKQSE